jgi:hypothetical protein
MHGGGHARHVVASEVFLLQQTYILILRNYSKQVKKAPERRPNCISPETIEEQGGTIHGDEDVEVG